MHSAAPNHPPAPDLQQLVLGLPAELVQGDPHRKVAGVAYDSRLVQRGWLFVALRGHSADGHAFIPDAVRRGAMALLVEGVGDHPLPQDVTVLRVPDTRKALAHVASAFYQHPQKELVLIGITGTNGKTSTSYLLEAILREEGRPTGIIGTVAYRFGSHCWQAPVTTPESLDLMRVLRNMADQGASHVIIEVSSHALDQGRTEGCPFEATVFTNLSRDHLDYHPSMEHYFQAKSRLFQGSVGHAIINLDDPAGARLARMTRAPVISYGLSSHCLVRAREVRVTAHGLRAGIQTHQGDLHITSPLLGRFQIHNILAAIATALALGINPSSMIGGIARLKRIPGRLEPVTSPSDQGPLVLVDYAHTPDALLKVLTTLQPLTKGRLITVFGCGGDRDKGKRREMGRVVAAHSHLVIVTSDNPRTEDPRAIAEMIEEGVREGGLSPLEHPDPEGREKCGYLVELDRAKAICLAINEASSGDLVLIAGKGHEDYQIIGTSRRPFDDREEARRALEGAA